METVLDSRLLVLNNTYLLYVWLQIRTELRLCPSFQLGKGEPLVVYANCSSSLHTHDFWRSHVFQKSQCIELEKCSDNVEFCAERLFHLGICKDVPSLDPLRTSLPWTF